MADAGKQQLPFILQGKYFAVKGQIEKDGALSAWCKNCPNRVLKGHLHAPSNFHKHLRFLVLTAICMAIEIGGIATLNIMNTQMDDIIEHGWAEINQGTRNLIQTKLECCGYDRSTDEELSRQDSCFPEVYSTEGSVGAEPKETFEDSCKEKLKEWFEKNKVGWVTGLASIGALQFMAGVITIFIMYKVKTVKSSFLFSQSKFTELSEDRTISTKKSASQAKSIGKQRKQDGSSTKKWAQT